MRPRVADGGGEGTRATTDEGAERGIRVVLLEVEDKAGQANEDAKDPVNRLDQKSHVLSLFF